MRYHHAIDEEATIVSLALRFANSKGVNDRASESWAITQYRGLKVLPPRVPYFIDDRGRVHARRKSEVLPNEKLWAKASPLVVERWWKTLRKVLDQINVDSNAAPDGVIKRPSKGKIVEGTIKVKFPAEGWSRSYVSGLSIEVTSQSFVAPTIDVFTAYAAHLLSQKPWRSRISKCEQCGKYFLNQIGRRGRRRLVCGEACANDRGDPTVWERQRRYRDARRKENLDRIKGH